MNRLRSWRLERGLSQLELAAATNIGRWAIQLAELGLRPLTPYEQDAISSVLGVKPEVLFGPGRKETTE